MQRHSLLRQLPSGSYPGAHLHQQKSQHPVFGMAQSRSTLTCGYEREARKQDLQKSSNDAHLCDLRFQRPPDLRCACATQHGASSTQNYYIERSAQRMNPCRRFSYVYAHVTFAAETRPCYHQGDSAMHGRSSTFDRTPLSGALKGVAPCSMSPCRFLRLFASTSRARSGDAALESPSLSRSQPYGVAV